MHENKKKCLSPKTRLTGTVSQVGGGGKNARLDVKNGGRFLGAELQIARENTSSNCVVNVASGAVAEFLGGVDVGLGGSDGDQMHGCWMTVGGESGSVAVENQLCVNHESTLGFDVPANGFARTPVQTGSIEFGKACATRPTLKVRCSPRNQVGYVTLAETSNGIFNLDGVNLDLPKGVRLLTAEDPRYDAKKLIVKLPVYSFRVIIRQRRAVEVFASIDVNRCRKDSWLL